MTRWDCFILNSGHKSALSSHIVPLGLDRSPHQLRRESDTEAGR